MFKKIINNTKSIYNSTQTYLCKGLQFASVGGKNIVAIIGALLITAIAICAISIEAALNVLYGIGEYGAKNNIQVKETPPKSL